MLKIRLTKLSNERHRIEFVRAGGRADAAELETRSCLLHDLVHFAVESEADLKRSFYGQIAAGRLYAEMAAEPPRGGEAMLTERIVVMLTKCAKDEATPEQFVAAMHDRTNVPLEPTPEWVSLDFARRALERLRQVRGAWKATPFGQTLELTFPQTRAGTQQADQTRGRLINK